MRVITESTKGITSQCTYRCVVLPDIVSVIVAGAALAVSMHLQVRGAP